MIEKDKKYYLDEARNYKIFSIIHFSFSMVLFGLLIISVFLEKKSFTIVGYLVMFFAAYIGYVRDRANVDVFQTIAASPEDTENH